MGRWSFHPNLVEDCPIESQYSQGSKPKIIKMLKSRETRAKYSPSGDSMVEDYSFVQYLFLLWARPTHQAVHLSLRYQSLPGFLDLNTSQTCYREAFILVVALFQTCHSNCQISSFPEEFITRVCTCHECAALRSRHPCGLPFLSALAEMLHAKSSLHLKHPHASLSVSLDEYDNKPEVQSRITKGSLIGIIFRLYSWIISLYVVRLRLFKHVFRSNHCCYCCTRICSLRLFIYQ